MSKTNKLRTRETRMFDEKTIYLNKAATKYVNIGADPVTFDAAIQICDRTTGNHITISTTDRILSFIRLALILLDGGDIIDVAYDATVTVTTMFGEMWKFTQDSGNDNVVLHKVNLKWFVRSSFCIEYEVMQRQTLSSQYIRIMSYIKINMQENPKSTKEEKWTLIHNLMLNGADDDRDENTYFQLCFGIITNRPYLETLESYADFYN